MKRRSFLGFLATFEGSCPLMTSLKQRLGLWLAYWMLRLTGNRDLANISRVLPLIPERRFALALEPLDRHPSELLSQNQWYLWRPTGASDMKNEPSSINPDHIIYANRNSGGEGFFPLFEVSPQDLRIV
jgi:hypothetical protein